MKIVIFFVTIFFGKKVGTDEFGNSYYQSILSKKSKRWVVYNGKSEPSKVPPHWELWLRGHEKLEKSGLYTLNITGTNSVKLSEKKTDSYNDYTSFSHNKE